MKIILTAIQNLDMLVRRVCKTKKDVYTPHGYWKDLLNIVSLAATSELSPRDSPASFLHAERLPRQSSNGKMKVKRTRDEIAATEAQKMAEAKERRAAKNARLHATLLQQLENPRFRALYVAVARLFAQQLMEDMQLSKQAEAIEDGPERYAILYQISLAGKWAPSPGKAHDRVTNLASAISSLLYHSFSTGPSLSLSPDTPASHIDTHILRSFLDRHVLIPPRKVIDCLEPLMSSNRWSEIAYNHVPSLCMQRNLIHFWKHDPTRFEQYLADAESGKQKISGATLMPHKLIAGAVECNAGYTPPVDDKPNPRNELKKRVAGIKVRGVAAQWKVMIDRVREAGALDNCLAICDISGSMGYIWNAKVSGRVEPIAPAIALTPSSPSLPSPTNSSPSPLIRSSSS